MTLSTITHDETCSNYPTSMHVHAVAHFVEQELISQHISLDFTWFHLISLDFTWFQVHGALVHWCIGALVHWWCIGAFMVHWCIGALVHWCIGALCAEPNRNSHNGNSPKSRDHAKSFSSSKLLTSGWSSWTRLDFFEVKSGGLIYFFSFAARKGCTSIFSGLTAWKMRSYFLFCISGRKARNAYTSQAVRPEMCVKVDSGRKAWVHVYFSLTNFLFKKKSWYILWNPAEGWISQSPLFLFALQAVRPEVHTGPARKGWTSKLWTSP